MRFDHCPANLLGRPAERLVVTGLRCWMAGYEFGDIACWETAWDEYCRVLGPGNARTALAELQYWIRTLRDLATRPIGCFPHCCNRLARDEWAALSLISACQRQDLRAARAAARDLSGRTDHPALGRLTQAGGSFAAALAEAGHVLGPVPLDAVDRSSVRNRARPTNSGSIH